MKNTKYRALAKDGTWRYGEYPHLSPEMSNTCYSMEVFWHHLLTHLRRETLGQWTGLLDKQGKEIYEGDIVKINSPIDAIKDEVCEIHFHDSVFCAVGENYHNILHLLVPSNLEVIGNIYENPELLKE